MDISSVHVRNNFSGGSHDQHDNNVEKDDDGHAQQADELIRDQQVLSLENCVDVALQDHSRLFQETHQSGQTMISEELKPQCESFEQSLRNAEHQLKAENSRLENQLKHQADIFKRYTQNMQDLLQNVQD